MKDLRTVHNSNILLDTSILVHYATKDFKERSGRILRVLLENKNFLTVSEITGFELLNCRSDDSRREKYFTFINGMPNHPVTAAILGNAAILSNECKRLTGSPDRIFPIPDLILGGTVLHYDQDPVFILTTDRRDFFEPLWETVAYAQVSNDNTDKVVHIYLLSLNRDVLLPQYQAARKSSENTAK